MKTAISAELYNLLHRRVTLARYNELKATPKGRELLAAAKTERIADANRRGRESIGEGFLPVTGAFWIAGGGAGNVLLCVGWKNEADQI